jgi:hypothetical protein
VTRRTMFLVLLAVLRMVFADYLEWLDANGIQKA